MRMRGDRLWLRRGQDDVEDARVRTASEERDEMNVLWSPSTAVVVTDVVPLCSVSLRSNHRRRADAGMSE